MTKIAIIQGTPTYGNLHKSIQRSITYIEQAAQNGAQLIVFGETWLGGYPGWIDHCPEVAMWQHPPVLEAWKSIYDNGLEIPSSELEQLQNAAKTHQVVIVMGINEVVKKGKGNGTIYNSIITITQNGELANLHRKLMPTFNEKLIYGHGDGKGLETIETNFGRIGSLVCWEHWMPLTRQAMHDEGEDIHIALWPSVKNAHQIASQQYAFEGRCFVIAVGQIMQVSDIPTQLKLPEHLKNQPETFICNGGSCVIGPEAEFILTPQFETSAVFFVELPNVSTLTKYKMTLSVSGHYQRSDVFKFEVNRDR
jgi:predicted amidohydrolase